MEKRLMVFSFGEDLLAYNACVNWECIYVRH